MRISSGCDQYTRYRRTYALGRDEASPFESTPQLQSGISHGRESYEPAPTMHRAAFHGCWKHRINIVSLTCKDFAAVLFNYARFVGLGLSQLRRPPRRDDAAAGGGGGGGGGGGCFKGIGAERCEVGPGEISESRR
ncbi:hypothetical protein K0M31_019759 [Melipona bicolor]|uniref:Uncharacterized protein n=1 Tax=Melipona bicolor TaxID=60889 RepID=A0AA40G316_9HYME|nr:hypothetical protein K0M31_019759 [Melipona bicolor]